MHPYHLLRYDRAIFTQPAIEKLQVSLKNSASKRRAQAGGGRRREEGGARCHGDARGMKKRRRWPNEIGISNSSPSGDHRKRPGDQGKPEHAGVPGGEEATKTEIKEAVQAIFKVKVRFGAHRELSREKSGGGESLPATVRTGRKRMCG